MALRSLFVTVIVGAAVSAAAIAPACAQSPLYQGKRGAAIGIAGAIADKDRPADDFARDKDRKPAALLAFAGLKPGMNVADIMPGKGYFTRLFSNVVAGRGHVWAVVPTWLVEKKPAAADAVKAIAATPAFANVSVLVQPLDALQFPRPLDLVWTAQNYHDVYYGAGADAALAFDRSVFAALRPGGVFVVIDHVANPGADPDIAKLHRIDPAIVRRQVEAAGFHFESQSTVLANPDDTHTVPVFDPAIRGHTDQVVLKFRKPAR
ncbi:class I SAM-dependent methyltransferase [Gluconacetobacter takamatsuzukensis]|uniref:Class I SAM-dependent methyltransferase n=1 Tax=Gluconacetobacter takamatsuzukensis TaxID=1286190 RepID=A0A7W4KEA6_9PROT|nr:class I SAM-dependent methyltransferase [Gluconacetobacter takamatsuzukensis]MBB2205351.1 class I SAM-dependent methyltransferase [Gluconacetobacter takamatsuzukensis]